MNIKKEKAIEKCLIILEHIAKAKEYQIQKERYLKRQQYELAANAREQQKKHIDQLPSLKMIYKLIGIATK